MIGLVALVALGRMDRVQAVETLVRDFVRAGRTVGITVGIAEKGKPPVVIGAGFADRERKVPPTGDTRFRMGSISKPITAMLTMKLVEEGKVRLDEDVRAYVPEFPPKSVPITVRHILSHQSGIRHYQVGKLDGGRRYERAQDALETFGSDPLLFEPGTKFSYSTHAFTLLAAVVEAAAKTTYDEYLGQTIRQPLGISSPRQENRTGEGERSQLYVRRDSTFHLAAADDTSWKVGGGGLETSANDLVGVGEALLANRILKRATRDLMWTDQGKGSYALGWRTYGSYVEHGGSQLGCQGIWRIYPERGIVLVILSNVQASPIPELANQVAKAWIGS